MARKLQTDVYFSADIESDGPIPGVHSMLSLGFAVCGSYDGERFEPIDPELHTFYRELRPAFDEFEPTALAAIGMDREQLAQDGADPAAAMTEAAAWVQKIAREISGAAKPVFVAYPLGFDWMFAYWYLVRFSETGSPFGFSSSLDMKTLYAARAGATVGASTKAQMPRHLLSNRKHTHNALDDAIEQGEMFQNLFVWDGRQR